MNKGRATGELCHGCWHVTDH